MKNYLDFEKEIISPEVDYYISICPDICFSEYALSYLIESAKQVENKYFVITPQTSKVGDEDWDEITNSHFVNIPYGDYLKVNVFDVYNTNYLETEKNLLQKSKENEYFEYIAKDTSVLNRSFKSIGKSNFVVGALMNSKIGDFIGPLPTLRGQTFIKVLNKSQINQRDFDEMKDSIKFSLLINRQNIMWDNWIQSLKDNSNIEDFRYDIF